MKITNETYQALIDKVFVNGKKKLKRARVKQDYRSVGGLQTAIERRYREIQNRAGRYHLDFVKSDSNHDNYVAFMGEFMKVIKNFEGKTKGAYGY